jgi:hypothetical protein
MISIDGNGTAVVTLRHDRRPQLYVLNPQHPATFGPVNQVTVRTRFNISHGLAAFLTTWVLAAVLAVLLMAAMRGYIPLARAGPLPRWYAHHKGRWSASGVNSTSSGNLTGITSHSSGFLASKWLGQRRESSGQLADDVAPCQRGAVVTSTAVSAAAISKIPVNRVHQKHAWSPPPAAPAATAASTASTAFTAPATTATTTTGGSVELQVASVPTAPLTDNMHSSMCGSQMRRNATTPPLEGGNDDLFPIQRQQWVALPQQPVCSEAPAQTPHMTQAQAGPAGSGPCSVHGPQHLSDAGAAPTSEPLPALEEGQGPESTM